MTNFWLPSSKDVKSLLKYLGKIIIFVGFPGGSDGKESACNAGDMGSIPGLGRSPGERHGNPLHYPCLENLHGQRSLTGYSPWGHKESDTTERLSLSCQYSMIWTMIMWQTIPKFPELLSGVRSSLVLLAGTRILGFRSGMRVKNNYRVCWKEEPKTAFLKKVSRTKVQFQIRNWRIKHGQK